MVEPPRTWDLLTASIAVADLTQPYSAWAFLAVQGLVRDAPGDRSRFCEIVAEERVKEITGPSAALRIASRLAQSGMALPGGAAADPWGKTAAERLQTIQAWTGASDASEYLERLRAAGFLP
jgi:hypothetical protein